jgi:hypothetical protein
LKDEEGCFRNNIRSTAALDQLVATKKILDRGCSNGSFRPQRIGRNPVLF